MKAKSTIHTWKGEYLYFVWLNPKDTVLNEASQTQKEKQYLTSLEFRV